VSFIPSPQIPPRGLFSLRGFSVTALAAKKQLMVAQITKIAGKHSEGRSRIAAEKLSPASTAFANTDFSGIPAYRSSMSEANRAVGQWFDQDVERLTYLPLS
jgi:hypothetical protein